MLEKIKNKLQDGLNGCKNWTGYKTKRGYGQIGIKYKVVYVHRAVYLLTNNLPLNSKTVIRHKCDNPSCSNIDHLESGTQKQNIQDIKDRNRHSNWNLKFCKRGHERVPENLYFLKSGSKSCKLCRKLRK